MKRITIVLDGVADRKIPELDNKTPLEYAHTPNLDALFKKSRHGLVKTIPDGYEVGSAVANLGLLGFDPKGYRGRAVIEAAGLNIPVNSDDMYIRVNFVDFEGDSFENSKIKSYSAHEISTEEAAPLAEGLGRQVFGGKYNLKYCGSFRNTLIVEGGAKMYPIDFAPAHDIIGRPIAEFIKYDGKEAPFFDLMRRAYEYLKPLNAKANGIWFWGASVAPDISGDPTGRIALSETLLMDGITKISGIKNIGTPRDGRTFEDFMQEKLQKAVEAAREYDDVYVHIQETDDLSHDLKPLEKARAVEVFDSVFLPAFLNSLSGDYTIKLSSDHFTFSDTGAHGGEPVPYMYYNPADPATSQGRFTEDCCRGSNPVLTAVEYRAL